MARELDTTTLDKYAEYFASCWLVGYQIGRPDRGRDWLTQEFYKFTYKDEWDYLNDAVRAQLGKASVETFNAAMNKLGSDSPREDAVLDQMLAETLAIDKNGKHIDGKKGNVLVGSRIVGTRIKTVRRTPKIGRALVKLYDAGTISQDNLNELIQQHSFSLPKKIEWPVYSGEEEERARIKATDRAYDDKGADFIDPLPLMGGMALVPNVSAEVAILGLDALLDGLDEGAGAATIDGRTGSQPVDPDAATTGTRLFALVMSDPAFAGAVDDTDGTVSATASSITDDTSADATGTLGYCRTGSTTTPPTLIDDHIDGEAGTSGADFNFNTLAIVSAATVSMTSYVVDLPQGSTAT